jgi:DNA-binding transcriptional MocR family regulator
MRSRDVLQHVLNRPNPRRMLTAYDVRGFVKSLDVEAGSLRFAPLDRNRPVGDQIVDQVIAQVESAGLPDGARMPSVRALAVVLGVNRNTVAQAYKELGEKGYLVARFGAGSTVRRPGGNGRHEAAVLPFAATEASAVEPPSVQPLAPAPLTAREWERRFAAAVSGLSAHPTLNRSAPDAINLFALQPYTGLFPLEQFRLCLNTVLRRQARQLLGYAAPAGYLPLRERIAARLKAQGISCEPGHILITSGSQQGIDLLARGFLDPGDGVVVEAPMYSIALKIFQVNRARLVPYPVTGGGIRLEGLERALGRVSPKLFYAVPNFQNPTTHSYSAAEKRELLGWVYRTGGLLLEDASDVELQDDHPHRPALAALDTAGRVLHLNTFSKTMAPAVRVGYLAGPAAAIRKLTELKEMTDLSHSLILQAATAEFMARGLFDEHIAAVRAFYQRRLAYACDVLQRELPEDTPFTHPGGGLCVWVDLPAHMDTDAIYRDLAVQGVLVSPRSLYLPAPGGRNGLRLCVAQESPERLAHALHILGAYLKRTLRRPPARPTLMEYQSIH